MPPRRPVRVDAPFSNAERVHFAFLAVHLVALAHVVFLRCSTLRPGLLRPVLLRSAATRTFAATLSVSLILAPALCVPFLTVGIAFGAILSLPTIDLEATGRSGGAGRAGRCDDGHRERDVRAFGEPLQDTAGPVETMVAEQPA